MDAAVRQIVRDRADDCCEYCRLPQSGAPFVTFHIEHIQSRQHVSDDSLGNLALACPDCNFHKGPNLITLDPRTREFVRLYHPRTDAWAEHFEFRGAIIVGLSAVGDATIRLLQMNSVERVELRAELQAAGDM
jgi:hypothetical protein